MEKTFYDSLGVSAQSLARSCDLNGSAQAGDMPLWRPSRTYAANQFPRRTVHPVRHVFEDHLLPVLATHAAVQPEETRDVHFTVHSFFR